jgi:hypothetical protein
VFAAVTAAACLVFAAYAGSFLYFFVDDEAIPLVYARNLLRGRGLVYTVLEGRVEGYSDFMHVLWSAAVLSVTRGLGYSDVAPIVAGKAVSFCAGLAIIIVTARALRRSGATPAGLVTGLGVLALAGPLAVWSCSSLETALFALLVSAFAFSLLGPHRWVAVVLGAAVVLERIDGPFFVFAVLFAAWAADSRRQREVARVAWPIVLLMLVYHGWRYAYFGSLLSTPLQTKVMYRLAGPNHSLTKDAAVGYLRSLVDLYGIVTAPALVVAAALALRDAGGRMAVIALLLLGIYVGVVEDWMFGWRFIVALLPFAAVITGLAVSRAPRAAGWCAAVAVLLWSGLAAQRFLRSYVQGEGRPIFWSDMHRGEAALLWPYYDLLVASRQLVHPGDHIAYNQAGLLPYILDAENVDDLGICSRFVAALPTTDLYFTAVGRYSPLTNQPVLRPAHAYFLYRDVQFVIARIDLLRKANQDTVPDTLLDGFFTRVAPEASSTDAIYRRTAKPAGEYRRDPSLFTENLAHSTRLTHASIDSVVVDPREFGRRLPFLQEQSLTRTVSRTSEILLRLGDHDADVSALYIGRVSCRTPCTVTLRLTDETGRETLRRAVEIPARDASIMERFETPARARTAWIEITTPAEDRVTLTDLRVEGQSRALADYVRRSLRFPPS